MNGKWLLQVNEEKFVGDQDRIASFVLQPVKYGENISTMRSYTFT